MTYGELEDAVQTHEEAITSLSDSTQQLSDDFTNYTSDNDQNIQDLQQTAGQLSFPLSQDTIDLLNQQTPTMLQWLQEQGRIGTVTLVAGSATITSPLISSSSLILLSTTTKGGTQGILSYTSTAGSATVSSTSGTDTSTVLYFILI